ncbi:hypothetical protein ANCDUO_16829 [Ancylostoma duodenale]|uniref:Uncharacterized protein n=1 Tax=Ancylostoma duodenale TaxID=51022 RepID=A0A0C2G2D7_9BILA|nr:hypothetical protein ANCDUO_16829 [Ancylostoma duodenale]
MLFVSLEQTEFIGRSGMREGQMEGLLAPARYIRRSTGVKVVEPLVRWRRVLVKDGIGQVIPLGSNGKPINNANTELPTSSLNAELYDREVKKELNSTLNSTLNNTLNSTFEDICIDSKGMSCGFTRKRSRKGTCDVVDSVEITKKR